MSYFQSYIYILFLLQNVKRLFKESKMKTLIKIIPIFFSVVFLFSCTVEDSNPIVPDTQNVPYEIFLIDIISDNITPLTANTEMELVLSDYSKNYHNMSKILPELNLTISQSAKFRAILYNHNLQLLAEIENIRNFENDIIDDANETLYVLLNDYNNGLMSEEEFNKSINSINNDISDLIVNCGFCTNYLQEMNLMRKDFVSKINQILNDEQRLIWNKYTIQNGTIFYGNPS